VASTSVVCLLVEMLTVVSNQAGHDGGGLVWYRTERTGLKRAVGDVPPLA